MALDIPGFSWTRPCSALLEQYRFVDYASGGTVGYATAAGKVVGVAYTTTEHIGDACAIVTDQIALVECGATIADGALVEVGTDGKAITRAAGLTQGRALAGGSSGHIIPVLLVNKQI
jgi:hypothetical protein